MNVIIFVIFSGIFILCSAFIKYLGFTESKALFMSWKSNHISLFFPFASSIRLSSVIIGYSVHPPGNPAQLFGEITFVSLITFVVLVVIIFVKIFLAVSIRVIGLTIFKFPSQSFGLGSKIT